jgi:hypothetical protein
MDRESFHEIEHLGLCMALEEEGVVQIAMTPFH